MTETAILLCGHGSRDTEAMDDFERMAAALRPRLLPHDFATGYLEFARPTIQEGLGRLVSGGARRLLAVPAMLLAASHVKNDLPREMNSFIARCPGVDVRLGRGLAIDAKLLAAAAERVAAAAPDRREDTVLVVIGRGTRDPDANADIARLARVLWESLGFGWAETGFSGVAHPRVDAVLERAARLGFRRIVVFPYFLFTGVLVKRIYAQTDAAAARFPAIDFVKASCLCDHPMVIEAVVERAAELLHADATLGPAINS